MEKKMETTIQGLESSVQGLGMEMKRKPPYGVIYGLL